MKRLSYIEDARCLKFKIVVIAEKYGVQVSEIYNEIDPKTGIKNCHPDRVFILWSNMASSPTLFFLAKLPHYKTLPNKILRATLSSWKYQASSLKQALGSQCLHNERWPVKILQLHEHFLSLWPKYATQRVVITELNLRPSLETNKPHFRTAWIKRLTYTFVVPLWALML